MEEVVEHQKRVHVVAIVVSLALIVAITGVRPASAESVGDDPVGIVAENQGLIEPVAPRVRTSPAGVEASTAGGTVQVSTDPDEGLAVRGPEGVEVELGIEASPRTVGDLRGGNVVYEGTAWLPFVVVTLMAIGLEIGLNRAVGRERMRRSLPGVRLAGVLLLAVAILQLGR